MLTRCSTSKRGIQAGIRNTRAHNCQFRGHVKRRLSTAPGAQTNAQAPPTSLPLFGSLTSELDRIAPRFEVDGSQIEIVREPREFYEILKAKILHARRRIYLSTLYIGKTEHELIAVIRTALQQNPQLKISFLTDALRGTRESPEPSCASLLAPLVAEFGPERVEVRMYHTPNLTGLRKRVIPKRINEGWGLQHMKLYGIDDEIILSGANLSTDYFTNRQDRYHIFHSKELTDYYKRIHDTICSISYDIQPSKDPSGYAMVWPASHVGPSPLTQPRGYTYHAFHLLNQLIRPQRPVTNSNSHPLNQLITQEHPKTLVYPIFQLTPLLPPSPEASTELPAMSLLLRHLTQPPFFPSLWTFTAGYFNMTPAIRQLLLSSNPASATVIAASPWANGFYGSKGISGMLPAAYTQLSRQFLEAVAQEKLEGRVRLMEWRRGTVGESGGWTYHAKGLWITLPSGIDRGFAEAGKGGESEEPGPSISLIGSSNYTQRSYTLDLESNALIVTRDPDLQRRLAQEERWLREHAKTVTMDEYAKPERAVGWHVRAAMWIVTLVGGAL